MHSRYQFNKSGYKIYTIYSVYSFNRDDADCVGRLIHLALEVDIHITRGENRVKGKIGRNHTLYENTLIPIQGFKRNKTRSSLESRCTVNKRGIRAQDRNTII